MLQAAGLTTEEERVYRHLVSVESAPAADVAARTGLAAADTERLLAGLERRGLVSRADGDADADVFAANPPDVALLPRLQRQERELEQARSVLTELLETYRGTRRRHDAGQLIELVTGTAALRHYVWQLQAGARSEMMWFCKAQYVAMPSSDNDAEFDALARGVRYRVVYERDYFEDPGSVDSLVAGVRAGEHARSVPALPLRMAVADREVAVCPLVPGGPSGSPQEPTAAVVRASSLLDALIALFESYWETAVPLRVTHDGALTGTEGETESLSATDRQLLSLLVAGVADKAIATQLQISRRTVQRRVQHLMDLTGAATRMQLAWQAARRGLV
ncbi:helix-turn-helix domain-containing protein [Streptomyces sp. 4N509B]|uniref:helix-turn-helix domain-containing protein n=1 Tax=Streptomyces sp. 4N509B TaxID=3457413 RepID=UPI003FD0FCB3